VQALAVSVNQRFTKEGREAARVSQEQGMQSIPTVIFNSRHLITGAQGVEGYSNILQQ